MLTIKRSAQESTNCGSNQTQEFNIGGAKRVTCIKAREVKRSNPLAVCREKGSQDSASYPRNLMICPVEFGCRQLAGDTGGQPPRCLRSTVSAIVTIVGLVTLTLFFTLGQPWGTINDISSVVLALSILPILVMLHHLHRHDAPAVSLVIFFIGVLAMLVVIVFQTLLIVRVIAFTQTAVVVPVAFGLFGASLMAYGYLAFAHEVFSRGLAVLGIIAGVGYAMVIIGFILGGQEHPLTAIGGLAAGVCYPIWAIWFGRMLLAGALTT